MCFIILMCYTAYIKCAQLITSLHKLFYNETDKNIQAVKIASENCGAVGQKLLQFLLMQNGFLSSTAKNKLNYIFEDCKIHSWEETQMIYKEDFGRAIEADFDMTLSSNQPIGSGTIGQVYKLYHRELKEYIAIKVRHLNIEKEASTFINAIQFILNITNHVVVLPFSNLINAFLKNIDEQLDFCLEAYNTRVIRLNCIEDSHIIVPYIYFNSFRVIAMSFHEGINFTDITDKQLRTRISTDMFLFNISSLLVHDFLHCDLHYGNWKIQLNPVSVNDYKLIIYDCGIIGSTHNNEINKKICIASMDGDYNKIYDIIAPDIENQKNGLLMKEYTTMIMNKHYENRSDRMTDFLKQLFIYQIEINITYLRCIQGLLTCIGLLLMTSEKLLKILGKIDGNKLEVLLCYHAGVLKKINKYPGLLRYLNTWIETDSNIESVFYEWMDEYFGHRDKDVFIDAMLYKLFINV